jgi:hypothetical protein
MSPGRLRQSRAREGAIQPVGRVPRDLVTILSNAAALAPFSHTLVVHLDSVVAIRRARENKSIEIAKAKVLTIKTAKTGGHGHGH